MSLCELKSTILSLVWFLKTFFSLIWCQYIFIGFFVLKLYQISLVLFFWWGGRCFVFSFRLYWIQSLSQSCSLLGENILQPRVIYNGSNISVYWVFQTIWCRLRWAGCFWKIYIISLSNNLTYSQSNDPKREHHVLEQLKILGTIFQRFLFSRESCFYIWKEKTLNINYGT